MLDIDMISEVAVEEKGRSDELPTVSRFFLIDYENVKTNGLNGVSSLTSKDTVIIFYSENAANMTFGLHRRINESRASIQYQKVEVGFKNALDFQLSSYLGYLICMNRSQGLVDAEYYVVTNDQGFSCLKSYWQKRKTVVMLVSDVTGKTDAISELKVKVQTDEPKQSEQEQKKKEPVKKKTPATSAVDELTKKVEALLKDKKDVAFVVKCINHYKTKQGVNNALMKEYKNNQRAGAIYAAIKPLLVDKKGR